MDDMSFAETPSTVIDTGPIESAGGGGAAPISEPGSLRGDLEAVFAADADKAEGEAAKAADTKASEAKEAAAKAEAGKEAETAEAKAKAADKGDGDNPAAKPETDAEPAKGAKEGEEAPTEGEKADAEAKEAAERDGPKRHPDAPQRFMPRAKELWRNTPNEVKSEVARMESDHAAEVQRYHAVTQRYSQLQEFDRLAHENGRDLRDSLARMNEIENLLKSNPVAGLNRILMEVGPRKADGQAFSFYEVAEFVASRGQQAYQQMVAQAAPRQEAGNQNDPKVAALEGELQAIKAQLVVRDILEPFKASHPRFDELQRHIAVLINSDMIPDSLSPRERLENAYVMADRIYPASHGSEAKPAPREAAPASRAATDLNGSKSIKSSPGSVDETVEIRAKRGESIEDSLRAEARRLSRA